MSARRFLIVLLAVASLASTAFGGQYSSVVVYGDSLSDNGNLFAASLGTVPSSPPYYAGRQSNGPVAVEYLATSLGAPLLDFAWIGATTGVGNTGDGGTVTSLGSFNLPGMTTTYTATKGALGSVLSTGLFVVWGGPNDILAPSPLDATPTDILSRALANELAIVADLKALGAAKILVPGMPDLGLTPYFRSLGPVGAAQGTAFTDAFNAGLQAQLPSDVIYCDTASLLRSVVANPAAYGFTNATDAYLPSSSGDPNAYVFYDDFHPTTAVHAILAQEFEAATVPEPATILLLGIGLGCLVIWRWRKSC